MTVWVCAPAGPAIKIDDATTETANRKRFMMLPIFADPLSMNATPVGQEVHIVDKCHDAILAQAPGFAAERETRNYLRPLVAINWRDPAMIRAMHDWQRFLDEVSWFLAPGESASIGDSLPWPRGPVEGLPQLGRLLSAATVTPVSVEGRAYELLAWSSSDSRRGWLCLPPEDSPIEGVHVIHQQLLSVCGGIVERFGEPASWWNHQDEVLTVSAARLPLAPVLDDYAWLWQRDGLQMPIEPDDYYVVAVEANGNLTLAHRASGHLLLFAPDHAFEGVTPLPGCPPYSLMTIDDALDLAAWIEFCAEAWSVR